MLRYKKIGLTVKPTLSDKSEMVSKVVDILRKAGADVYVDAAVMEGVSVARALSDMKKERMDALLVIGGDGTILRAVREIPDFSIPILSVNRGVLGFLAEVAVDEAETLLPALLSDEGQIEERTILCVKVMRGKKELLKSFALNEAAISQGTIARLLDLRTDINGEPLATFHADGLIIATPTGSTAYSLAAGGPVVHPHLSALILTPINPHSLTQKPVVIPGGTTVGVDILQSDEGFVPTLVGLTLDGQVYMELQRDDRVIVSVHSDTVKFIRRREDTFFHTLRTKLKWGERI